MINFYKELIEQLIFNNIPYIFLINFKFFIVSIISKFNLLFCNLIKFIFLSLYFQIFIL